VKDATLASMSQILWRLIERHDLAPEPIFRGAGIDPAIINDPHAHIARPKSDALMRALAERIADPAFGLQAATCWHPSNLGTLGYAWLASSTLRTALTRLFRYWRIVIGDVTVSLEETPDGVEFVHIPPVLDSTLESIRGDIMMAILHDKVHPAKAVNATIISLDEAPQGYKDFDRGAAKKFVIDPHGLVGKAAA